MGVTGLTTFLSRCGEKYKKKIYLSQDIVVIDGSNLMFHIYSSYDVRKYNHHLFGGDCGGYARAVRQYFQKLKCCKIHPIVIFDGAYEAGKLKTRMKRFATSLKENVRQSSPGKSYTTCLMKDVFVEVLVEQNIDHFQTEFEADDTIAFIAQRLSCPVLSSDSDFYIYANISTIPLETINFKKNAQKLTSKKLGSAKPLSIATHVLEGKCMRLQEVCESEFKLSDYRLLPLTAVVIGNDQISNSVFANFMMNKDNSKSGRGKQLRIEYLLKWFGKQVSFEKARETMLGSIKETDRDDLRDRIEQIVSNYMGAGGESYVWNLVRSSPNLLAFIEENLPEKMCGMVGKNEDCGTVLSKDLPSTDEVVLEAFKDLSINDHIYSEQLGTDQEEDFIRSDDDQDDDDDDENKDYSLQDPALGKPNVPEWFLKSMCLNKFPTPVCKILYNRTIYLTPQVEVTTMPSSHAISVPIIQALGGILYGPGEVTLVSRDKYNPVKLEVPNISSSNFAPCVIQSEVDFRQTIPHEKRLKILLETLQVKPEEEEFIHEWPPFMKIWIASCIYYFRKLRKTKDSHLAVAVATATILCCLKNFSFSQVTSPPESNGKSHISALLQQQVFDKAMEKLMNGSAGVPNYDLKKFWRSYDMVRVFFFSQFQSVLFHGQSVNSVLGEPLRAPKFSTLDCNMVYNICTTVVDQFHGNVNNFIQSSLPKESPLRMALLRFLEVVLQGAVLGPVEKMKLDRKEKRRAGKNSASIGEDGDPEKLNRFVMLADALED